MRFSIIIPIYRVEQYLRQCIDSVLAQSFTDFEVILVDDGSTDNCPAICDEYAQRDMRVKVIHKPNGGLSDARNAGLDIAKGEYVLFLDSDDWWDNSEFLKKLNGTIEKENADIIIFGMKKFYSNDGRIGDVCIPKKCDGATRALSHAQAIQKYMQRNIFVACACDKAIRKSVIDSTSQRFVKGQLSEDIEWCAKLLKKDVAIDVLEEAVYVYRQQVTTSITANVNAKNILCILDVIKRYATYDVSVPLKHFLANQYVLLITNLMRLPGEERSKFENDVKQYWWLLNYNWYPYVNKVSKVKPLGFNLTKKILRFYYLLLR